MNSLHPTHSRRGWAGANPKPLVQMASPTVEEAASTAVALAATLAELHALAPLLFDSGQPGAGLFLSQLKILFLRLPQGIASTRSDFLSLLAVASRIRGSAS